MSYQQASPPETKAQRRPSKFTPERIQQIKDLGVLLKDAEKGLCDFPNLRQGRVVYLCWQLGEDRIEYWHDIETGFAGREPLDDTDSR